MNTETKNGDRIPLELRQAFAPLHKRAFGVAIGTAAGGLIFVVTLAAALLPHGGAEVLPLLAQYFAGYEVSVKGAFIGFGWGLLVGFVAGWFAAFCRNLVLAASIWLGRTRAELEATRDFLDHI